MSSHLILQRNFVFYPVGTIALAASDQISGDKPLEELLIEDISAGDMLFLQSNGSLGKIKMDIDLSRILNIRRLIDMTYSIGSLSSLEARSWRRFLSCFSFSLRSFRCSSEISSNSLL